MEKFTAFCFLFCIVYLFGSCNGQWTTSSIVYSTTDGCKVETNNSGRINYRSEFIAGTKCWLIKVPEGSFVKLHIEKLELTGWSCQSNYLEISETGSSNPFKFCYSNSTRAKGTTITAENDVQISFGYIMHIVFELPAYLTIGYNIEKMSEKFPSVLGVGETMDASILKLRNQFSTAFGWGANTHRAITALYLSGNTSFNKDTSPGDELMAKQLELQAAVALLRNSTDPIPLTDLSMFINALTATCYNPRQFYGHNLLQILSERLNSSMSSHNPGAYLTLCNANWTIPFYLTESLYMYLEEPSKYPFNLDTEAMTILALSCAMKKTGDLLKIYNVYRIYNASIHRLISKQQQNGSFGNVYTTALVTQALIASGQEKNSSWNWKATFKFLIKELNSTSDFLSTSLTLPILNGKTLLDLTNVNCTKQRKHGGDEEISEIMNKLGGKIRVRYSLYIGDRKDIMYSLYLRVPENSSAFDVMKVAQEADQKYSFRHQFVSNEPYVFEIAGITNDPEAQKYWFLYVENTEHRMPIRPVNESFENQTVKDGDHLIMWFRSIPTKSLVLGFPWSERPGTGYTRIIKSGIQFPTTKAPAI